MRKFLLLSLFALSLTSLNGQVAGGNLVVNAGFETGDFTGWTTHTCGEGCEAQGWSIQGGGNAFSGSYAAATECVNALHRSGPRRLD